MSIRRGMAAVLSAAAVAAGVLVGATPANAVPFTATITPSSGTTNQIVVEFSGIPAAGEVRLCTDLSMSATDCASDSTGPNVYYIGVPSSTTVNVEIGTSVYDLYTHGYVSLAAGTYLVVAADVSTPLASATLALGSATSSGPTDPALVYPTVTFDPQGGACTVPLTITNNNGSNPTYTMPGAEECSRAGYELYGWSPAALNERGFRPMGSTVYPTGFTANLTESVTLYAVWVGNGVEVTYDANVGSDVDCLKGDAPTSTRTTTSLVSLGAAAAATAPCTPSGMVLAGWALTGDGAVAVQPGGAIPSDWEMGSSHRLYAKWQVTYELSVTPRSQTIEPAGSPSVVVTARRNGQVAADAVISYQWTGQDEYGDFDMGSKTVTTNAQGAATIPMGANVGQAGYVTVTVAYGDQTASSTFTVEVPKSATRSITITGERGTVRGKPGVMVDGLTTGFAEGEKFVPYIKFPGQTSYSAGIARLTVDADGEFSWQRKTGKKIYVYFTNEDGTVKSNRVIIQAK